MRFQDICLAALFIGAYAKKTDPPTMGPSESSSPSKSSSPSLSTAPSSKPSFGPSVSTKPSFSAQPSLEPSVSSQPSKSSEPSAEPSINPTTSNVPSTQPSFPPSDYPSYEPSKSSMPTSTPTETCIYMDPNPFTFGPPVPSEENNNIWPDDYQFWTSQVSGGGVPWSVQRSSETNYYLQSPNFNGAQEVRQANATLQVCNFFKGGDLEVNFEASVNIDNGQLFQVVVDGAVATGGNQTTPIQNKNLIVPLSPGSHWINFVYTWTNPGGNSLPTSSTGIVKIFTVTLPQLNPQFPTSSPTGLPSLDPSRSPSSYPSKSPSARPSSSPTTPPPTDGPTVSPTLSPTETPTVSPTMDPTATPTVGPTLGPTTETPTTTPTVAPTLNPTYSEPTSNPTTPEPTRVQPLPTTGRPDFEETFFPSAAVAPDPSPNPPPLGGTRPPHDGGWSPPHAPPHGRPDGGWSSSHDRPDGDGWSSQSPIAWKNDSWSAKGGKGWRSKSAKSKTSKSYSRPIRWIPASGGDWLSLSYGWVSTGWGNDGHSDDFSWGGKWGRGDSSSSGDAFKWERPMRGKASKSKAGKKGGWWDSGTSMSYGNNNGDKWEDGTVVSSKNQSQSDDWWKSPSSTHSLPGGVWVDPAWQVSKGSDSSSSSPQGHQSSKKASSNSSKSQSGYQAGQSGKGHSSKSSSGSGRGSDIASHNYSSTESIQSTKSSKDSTRQVGNSRPHSSNSGSDEVSLEDYNKMKYWAEKKWQNKEPAKSAGDRVGSSSVGSKMLLLTSAISMSILFGFAWW